MSAGTSFETRRHPVADLVTRLHHELDAIADSSVWSMTEDELTTSLTDLTRLQARAAELTLRVAAHADRVDLGSRIGSTSAASWWAHATRQTRSSAHRQVRLAAALDSGHEQIRRALSRGDLLVDQAVVIVDAVEALPTDLVDRELVRQAEQELVRLAAEHDARSLKILGRRILEVLAPEIAEAHEQRELQRDEKRAAQRTRFAMSDDGHGASHGRFTLPTAQAEMLRKQLMAIAAPKHRAALAHGQEPPAERQSLPQRLGQAFAEYVERYPAEGLPTAGGVNATVVVTMSLDTLLGGLKAASLDTGGVITASQARRLACEAGIIPAVLNGTSQVLDLGRRTRLHTSTQRTALALRDRGCTAEGCDWPPALCHAHHDVPWAQGGSTSVQNGRLLCPRHHARVHDPGYATESRPGGKIAFSRRI